MTAMTGFTACLDTSWYLIRYGLQAPFSRPYYIAFLHVASGRSYPRWWEVEQRFGHYRDEAVT